MTAGVRGQIRAAVDAAYAGTRGDLSDWADPHSQTREPELDEYSRVTDPERYLLLGARVDAWAEVLVARGIAAGEDLDPAAVVWSARATPPTDRSRQQRITPLRSPDAASLLISRQRREDVDDLFLAIGVGEPAEQITLVPFCGCDACDDGSEPLIEQIDNVFEHLLFGDQLYGLNQPPPRPPDPPWIG
ncbi:MAG: DUF6226 family protein [Knoellia sp.]